MFEDGALGVVETAAGVGARADAVLEPVARLLPPGAPLDAVIVCSGPGGFAAARAGVAAARGLALALGVPSIGVDLFSACAVSAGGAGFVEIALPGGATARRRFADGAPAGAAVLLRDAPFLEGAIRPPEDPEARLTLLARAALTRPDLSARPASPFYLKPPDAAPSRLAPPALLQ